MRTCFHLGHFGELDLAHLAEHLVEGLSSRRVKLTSASFRCTCSRRFPLPIRIVLTASATTAVTSRAAIPVTSGL